MSDAAAERGGEIAGRLDRAVGAMQGFAVGDALGATVEFLTPREIKAKYGVHKRVIGGGWLDLRPGQITDDTEMMLIVGRVILAHRGWNLSACCAGFADWLRGGPVDVGNTVRRGIRRFMTDGTLQAPYSDGDAGNGACMRNLPVALATLDDPAAFRLWTLEQCRITHNHPLSNEATLSLGHMVRALVRDADVAAARDEANGLVAAHPDFRFSVYRPGDCSPFIVDTVKTVFHAYFGTETFRDCLIETVNQGGDADTAGALAGMLAGATYGAAAIPREWLDRLDPDIASACRKQAAGLLRLVSAGTNEE